MTVRAISHPAAVELEFTLHPEVRDQVSAWWVDGLLVDAGGALTVSELQGWLGERRPRAILLGHHHEDHSAGAALLAARGIPVHGSRGTAARLRRPSPVPAYRARLWGQRQPVRVTAVPAGLGLVPVDLPGHSPDQLGYFHERTGWLFSGDLVLRKRQRVALPGEDPWAMMSSLRRAIALDPAALATSHHSLITSPLPTLQATLAYLEDLAAQVERLHRAGAAVGEIVTRVLGGEPRTPMGPTWRDYSAGEFSGARWIRSFIRR